MKSFFLVEPGKIEMRETAIPEPENGELIIKVERALTCGTDLKAFRRGHPKMPMPTPFGHEFSGTIADAGKSVNGYREGDAIMTVHTAPCGDCHYCNRRLENLCPITMDAMLLGAYAEYIKISKRVVALNTFHKPDHLTFEEAAILEPLACVVHGMAALKIHINDTVLIIGAGAIGLMHILMAKAEGIENIIVSGKHRERLQLAKQLGAHHTIDASHADVQQTVLERTNGFGAAHVFECTGRPAVWEQAIEVVAKGGNVMLFGGCPAGDRISVDTERLHYDQISLIGRFHFTPRDVAKAHKLLTEKKVDVSKLISATLPLERLPEAFQRLQSGDGVKYAIQP